MIWNKNIAIKSNKSNKIIIIITHILMIKQLLDLKVLKSLDMKMHLGQP